MHIAPKLVIKRKATKSEPTFKPVDIVKDIKWFVIPIMIIFVIFATWRLSQ